MKQTIQKINYTLWQRRFFLVIADIVSVLLAGYLALLTRFEFVVSDIEPEFLSNLMHCQVLFVAMALILFQFFHMYQSLWEYASISEMTNILMACILYVPVQAFGVIVMQSNLPRSYYLLSAIYLFLMVAGLRASYRVLRVKLHSIRASRDASAHAENVMIIGAGEAGRMLIQEITNSAHVSLRVRCIIDDDATKIGKYILGAYVAGNRHTIAENVRKYEIRQIFVAIPSAAPEERREILELCKEVDCKVMIIPGTYQVLRGEVNISRFRPVTIEDLLGRDEITVNMDEILGYVADQVVMVTGGGGSIGSELCRQIAAHNPKQLIIFDIYENNAYAIQQELRRRYPDLNLEVLIGSVRDEKRLDAIFAQYRPQLVYHAAAHKHVPLMEDSPNEAIKNNVLGTYKVVQAADRWGVRKFVLISTDKAVNPTNVMGATKRICEMIVQTWNRHSDTDYVAVRFGNVLGSNGSVVPLFRRQIEEGGPVTVTHPDIIRYFMTISEAVSLTLQAGAYARGGEIFVLDMGDPVKILDLAKNMIRLSGYQVDKDIKIEFTGLRPGEKLFEELLMDEEGMTDTPNKKIFVGHPIHVDEQKLMDMLATMSTAIEDEGCDVRSMIRQIVPTYHQPTPG